MVSILLTVTMGALFIYMWNKAHFAETRRLSFIPLLCAVFEATGIGSPALSVSPLLSVVQGILYVVIVACCVGEMKRDARRFSRKQRRLSVVVGASESPNQCA